MIAVLTPMIREFKEIGFHPQNQFIPVTTVDHVMGRRFTGVICLYGWHRNNDTRKAYESLLRRQPELFKTK